jgi:predicted dehydrogenase
MSSVVTNKRLRVGVIGLGRVSDSHLAGLAAYERAELVAVCDIDVDRVEAVAAAYGVTPHTSVDRLLADPEVDAVAILLPHPLHHPVAKAALEHGKHIAVEKPFTVTEAEARELVDIAGTRGLTIAVAENTRFVLAYLELQKLLSEGALGEIRAIRGYIAGSAIEEYHDDTAMWKRQPFGAGTIIDTSPHMIYLMRWLFSDVDYIHTVAQNWMAGIEVDDHAVQIGKLVDGTLFSLEYCLVAEYPWTERVEVHGSEGSLIIDQLLDPPAVIYRGEDDLHGTPVASVPYNMAGWKAASIALVVRDFVDAALDRRPAGVDLDDAVYVQRVIDCSYRSAEAGGTRVTVDGSDLPRRATVT